MKNLYMFQQCRVIDWLVYARGAIQMTPILLRIHSYTNFTAFSQWKNETKEDTQDSFFALVKDVSPFSKVF